MPKILVIEDTKSLREDIIEILQCLQFESISAENGAIGLQLAQQYLPDLIICDIMMPEMDGYEVLHTLSNNPKTASIPFIFLSAKSDKSDIRQGMNLGADDYLTKPFSIYDLQEAITARLQRKLAIAQPYLSEIKRSKENINKLTHKDALTTLPNRTWLYQWLEKAVIQAQQNQQLVAVICLDLNHFQTINANLGYGVGDLLLQSVAVRLSQFITHPNVVARTGGDDFSIVLCQINRKEDIDYFTESILSILSQPYIVNEHRISIHFNIGISFYPESHTNREKLLNNAETAMRCAKNQYGTSYQFYHPQMDKSSAERQVLETTLNSALEHSEFQLYYQPQVALMTGKMIGAEALMRWHHPKLGVVSPSKFIPVAEETGLIVPIGEWVLRTACKQVQAWKIAGLLPIQISINLSACQFKQQNLKKIISKILEESGLNPNLLELELTESSVMENVDFAIETLYQLKAMGIRISLDDFGTGYSSLSYLKRFPIDALKIDRCFVNDINGNDAAIAKAIITMAQSLHLNVIAEGVETQEQLNFLKQHGCDAIQGYLFSPPLPSEKFEKLLLEEKHL